MKRVVVTENAKANLRSYYAHAAGRAPRSAEQWLNRFHKALATLASNPERCSLAPENNVVEPEIRQFFFGKARSIYRALFTIAGDEVQVLHIRRGTMGTARADVLFDSPS